MCQLGSCTFFKAIPYDNVSEVSPRLKVANGSTDTSSEAMLLKVYKTPGPPGWSTTAPRKIQKTISDHWDDKYRYAHDMNILDIDNDSGHVMGH